MLGQPVAAQVSRRLKEAYEASGSPKLYLDVVERVEQTLSDKIFMKPAVHRDSGIHNQNHPKRTQKPRIRA